MHLMHTKYEYVKCYRIRVKSGEIQHEKKKIKNSNLKCINILVQTDNFDDLFPSFSFLDKKKKTLLVLKLFKIHALME